MLIYSAAHKLFVWKGAFETRHLAEDAGFTWHDQGGAWVTANPYVALRLVAYADLSCTPELLPIRARILSSQTRHLADRSEFPAGLMDFQAAGVYHLEAQLQSGRRAVACMDDQGLGKTIQAIGLANRLGARRLLVLCPAGLRLNWAREITKWHTDNPGVTVAFTGKTKLCRTGTNILSYDLAASAKELDPELVIIDESHYLKNYGAKRTRLVLGDYRERWPGLVGGAPVLFLSGTPLPNGRPNELYPILRRCAPDVIDGMSYQRFLTRFCRFYENGNDIVITGAKNEDELYARLRGSGFMLRRLKQDVLTELPPKRYQMVVFPAEGELKKVIAKERAFDAAEIIKHGAPVGDSALPELRREMGIAKAPACIGYITDLLEGGAYKVVVFAHHLEVVRLLAEALDKYGALTITGSTSARNRQQAVDTFQGDRNFRVFIGNEAAAEGITLTAACDVIDVEPEWVPGKNEQRYDRLHRIGQVRGVIVHLLVVEGSLDAHILGAAAGKAKNIREVLDR